MEKCEQCRKTLVSGQIVNFGSMETGSRELCMDCYNGEIATKWGIKKPNSNFKPLTVTDREGKSHTFYFRTMLTTGLGIQAFEMKDGEEDFEGYKFAVMEHPETDSFELFEKLRQKIQKGLSHKFLQSETRKGMDGSTVSLIGDDVVGRIAEGEDDYPNINVVIDGKSYSWEEFGSMLSGQIGGNFKLSLYDPYDDVPDDQRTEIKDKLWWIDDTDEGVQQ